MKENVLDVLMYLFQNYMDDAETDPDRESIQTELLAAGFPSREIQQAFEWLDGLIERRLQCLHVDAGLRQQRRRRAGLLLQQGEQQVRRRDHLVVVPDGQALRIRQRLLELGGQLVLSHGEFPSHSSE